jgi:CBS domain-containing protein
MSTAIVSADEEASLAELADLMLKHGIKRVPILRDGVLVGMVSRTDVIRAVVENLDNLLEPTGRVSNETAGAAFVGVPLAGD